MALSHEHYPMRPSQTQVDTELPDKLARIPNTSERPVQQSHTVIGWDGTGWACRGSGGYKIQLPRSRELQLQSLPVLRGATQRWFNTLLHSPPWLQLRLTELNCYKIQCVGRGLCAWIPRLNTQRWHTEQGGDREAGDDPQWQETLSFQQAS